MSEPHVFISYVREDQEIVDRLRAELAAAGVRVWLDRHSIQAGSRWKQAIRRAIENGAFSIACFSDAYHQRLKTYMNEELTLAVDALWQMSIDRSWFLPIKLSPVAIPDRDVGGGETLRSLQHVDLSEDWQEGVRRILAVVRPLPARLLSLQEKLGAASRFERLAAIEALGATDDDRAVEILRSFDSINTDTELVKPVLEALGRLSSASSAEAIASVLARSEGYRLDLHWAGADAMVAIGRAAVPTLIRLIDDRSEPARAAAARALGKLQVREAAAPLGARLDREDDSIVRVWILEGLGGIGGDDVLPHLIAVARDSKTDAYERQKAIESLGLTGSKAAVPALIEIGKGDRFHSRNLHVIEALERIASPDSVQYLIDNLVLVDKLGTVYFSDSAIRALRKIGTPEALSALEDTTWNKRVERAYRRSSKNGDLPS